MLSNCLSGQVNGSFTTVITPFNDVLANYNTHKSKIEPGGECYGEGTAMFDTIRQLSVKELATLKENNAQYAALLSTDYGEAFEADVGNADIIKIYATLASPPAPGGASGAAPINPSPVPTPGTGVNCVAPGVNGNILPLSAKLSALNCLVLDTPHSPFWVTQGTKNNLGGDLADAGARYSFLGYENWDCTFSPDEPFLPSCRKHDTAYDTLVKLSGRDLYREKDSIWNPRNKYLADAKFQIDLYTDAANWDGTLPSCQSLLNHANPVSLLLYSSCSLRYTQKGALARAILMTIILEKYWSWQFADWDIEWEVSDDDLEDIRRNPQFFEDNSLE